MLSRAIFLLLVALIVAPAWGQAPKASRMYKCVDAKGKVYYTQLPPAECLGRASQELDKSGTVVIRRNEAALTPEQRAKVEAEHEAERKRKLEEEQRIKEERRQSMALLNTYSSEKDIEEARARALKDNQATVTETERRIQAAMKRQKELNAEKAPYASKPLPKELAENAENNELELKNQQELLEARRKQADTINAKYDEDKRRYIELTRGKPAQAKK
jgi:DNA segregation ATPase FtsK/SpoIIIE-like protein